MTVLLIVFKYDNCYKKQYLEDTIWRVVGDLTFINQYKLVLLQLWL